MYNETPSGPIKPTPLIGVLGLIEKTPLKPQMISSGDELILVGATKDELGGSEYLEYVHDFIGGVAPKINLDESKKNMHAVLSLIRSGKIKAAHDCAKGGLAIAVSELCMTSKIGCKISLDRVPNQNLDDAGILFSESHSRYLLVVDKSNLSPVLAELTKSNTTHSHIGTFSANQIIFSNKENQVANLMVDKAHEKWFNSLRDLVLHA